MACQRPPQAGLRPALRLRLLHRRLPGGVLDERNDPARHEPRRAHGLAGARDLGDLDDAAPGGDLDPATRTCRGDLVHPRAVVCGDDDLDTITLHGASVLPFPRHPGPSWTRVTTGGEEVT